MPDLNPSGSFVQVLSVPVDPITGKALANASTGYTLASNQTLAAGANTTPVSGVARAAYVLDISGTFTAGASLNLQALGSDGATWRNVTTGITAAGTVASSFQIGANSSVRLLNAGTQSVTGLYATLS